MLSNNLIAYIRASIPSRETSTVVLRLLSDYLDGSLGGSSVATVFGRNGNVTAQPGDYDASFIDYDNSGSGSSATNVQEALDDLFNGSTDPQELIALIALSGVPSNSEDLGIFSGNIIPDASTIKAALQALETAIESFANPMTYKGLWNAATNTPTLANGIGQNGDVYQVSVGGTVNFGSGPISFEMGDKAVYNGSLGQYEKWDMTDAVTSIFGRFGNVVAVSGDYTASQVTNVPSGTISSTNLQAAINEVSGDITSLSAQVDLIEDDIDQLQLDIIATQNDIDDHISDPTDAHDASAISSIPLGNLVATDVQGALNELQTDVDTRATTVALNDHITDVLDAHDASAISYDNTTSGLAAVNVQSAIDELAEAAVEFPLKAPTGTLLDPPSYGFAGGDDDTGIFSTGDGNVSIMSNGNLKVSIEQSNVAIEGNLDVDTINGTTFPQTGAGNTLAGFDEIGSLYSVPTWNYIPVTNGLQSNGSTPGTDETGLSKLIINTALGDGTSGSVENFNTISIDDSTNANYLVESYNTIRTSFQAINSAIVENATAYSAYMNGDITGNLQGLRFDSQMNAENVSGFLANIQGTISNQLEVMNLYSSALVENNIFSINAGNNGNSTSGSITGFNYGNQGTAEGFTAVNLFNNSDISSYINAISFYNQGNTENLQGVNISNEGDFNNLTAYNFNNTGVSSSSITGVQISDNSNSPLSSISGINLNINGTYENINGISVNLDSATSPNRKVGLNISGASINTFTPFTTISDSPSLVDGGNSIVTQFSVLDGSPISGTSVLANNLSGLAFFEDDYEGDAFYGLGYAMVGFVGQVGVVDTKTVSTISMALAGASVPPQSTGGTIDELIMFNAKGLLPAGGTVTTNTVYGLKVDASLSAMSPNKAYGVYVEDANADNHFEGDITRINGLDTSFPSVQGAAGSQLTNDGSGNLSWQLPTTSPKYVQTFNVADWVLNVSVYELVISQATHSKGTSPMVQVFELVGSDYIALNCTIKVNASGDVTLQTTSVPDNSFQGKLIIL